MKYILNSAVITAPGTYEYFLISADEAKQLLTEGDWESTIGYPETATALSQITGVSIPVNRKQVQMQPGDEALVFRLTRRLSDPELKGKLGISNILSNSEIGILHRMW